MKFENIPIAEATGQTFKNPVAVHVYDGELIGPRVGVATLKVSGDLLTCDLDVDEQKVQGDFDFLLFLSGSEIVVVLIKVMCKNPHNSAPTKVKIPDGANLPFLPPTIIRSGKSKVWFKNTTNGTFIHRDNLKDLFKLK